MAEAAGEHAHTNRLAAETSPYLLQHAHNPVDWYAWGAEAWARAKSEDKPVLVSIGYAACHWCHVMERESFEDEALAALQNDLFVSIKVDREERPDVDEIYMEAVQLIHGQGGWPLNVFCTPEGLPFYGGTYFPPQGRQGMPGWGQVLEAVAGAYREQHDNVIAQGRQIVERIEARPVALDDGRVPPAAESLALACEAVMQNYDATHGGYGGAPKFPQPYFLSMLLHRAVTADDARAREQVLHTLRRMAAGGMYDQLGGGFHRYAVDARWLAPHFEKMLYDNALLAPLYADAWRLTGEADFARVARETLAYLVREMQTPEGAFHASTDADSEGVEGKYFVWSLVEVREALGEADAAVFADYYDVTAAGNFEGANILHVNASAEEVGKRHGRTADEVEATLARGREELLRRRAERVPPATDVKVIAAWNGMAIDALARGGAILDEPAFVEAARRAGSFVVEQLRTSDGLYRIHAGGRVSVAAFVDDYAGVADGLLSLYEATGEERWFGEARSLVGEMVAKFWDEESGGFFTTGSDNERLVARNKPVYDGATPSGNSLAARAMARLYALTSEGELADRLEAMGAAYGAVLERAPTMMPLLVQTRDWLERHQTVAIVGEGEPARALARTVWDGPPRQTMVLMRAPGAATVVPQLEGKEAVDGAATAYVCRGQACSAPVTSVGELEALLARGVGG